MSSKLGGSNRFTFSSHNVKVPVAVGISFLTLFIGALMGGIGIYLMSRRGRHPFQELKEEEPKSFMAQIIADPSQSDVSPFQLSTSDEAERGRVPRGRENIKGPALSRISNFTAVERPPSYPQYSPAESENITREINFGRSISTSTIFNSSGASSGSSTLGASERHYNPRGPLNSDRPRKLMNEKGSAVPHTPA